jgi:hypothetical protein
VHRAGQVALVPLVALADVEDRVTVGLEKVAAAHGVDFLDLALDLRQ